MRRFLDQFNGTCRCSKLQICLNPQLIEPSLRTLFVNQFHNLSSIQVNSQTVIHNGIGAIQHNCSLSPRQVRFPTKRAVFIHAAQQIQSVNAHDRLPICLRDFGPIANVVGSIRTAQHSNSVISEYSTIDILDSPGLFRYIIQKGSHPISVKRVVQYCFFTQIVGQQAVRLGNIHVGLIPRLSLTARGNLIIVEGLHNHRHKLSTCNALIWSITSSTHTRDPALFGCSLHMMVCPMCTRHIDECTSRCRSCYRQHSHQEADCQKQGQNFLLHLFFTPFNTQQNEVFSRKQRNTLFPEKEKQAKSGSLFYNLIVLLFPKITRGRIQKI